MATFESQQRAERRRHQRWVERWHRDPEYLALRQWAEARYRYLRKHPWASRPKILLWMHCLLAGIQLGGRPPKARRCTKRLGTRYCWNWQGMGTDRCYRHRRQQRPPAASVAGSAIRS